MSKLTKLTSFNQFGKATDEQRQEQNVFEDLLINPDHVVQVSIKRKGTSFGIGAKTYRPTILSLTGDRTIEIAEDLEAAYRYLNGGDLRGCPRYIEGYETDKYGNPLPGE